MTIASEITRINNNIASAYTACNGKGATMPVTQNSANLATCIDSIQTGGGGVGIPREVSINGVYQMPSSNFTFSLPSNARDVGGNAMYYAFYGCTGLTSADLSSLTSVSSLRSLYYAFYGCTGLTNVDLSSLTSINGDYAFSNAFRGCSSLSSVDLSALITVSNLNSFNGAFYECTNLSTISFNSLTSITGNTSMAFIFSNCTSLASVSFPELVTIGSNTATGDYGHLRDAFAACTNLTSLTFPNLEKIYCTGGTTTSYGTFANNNYIQKMYFPKLDTITYGTGASSSNRNACKNVFYGCSALTELHFAAANQSAIQASAGYSTAWGRGAGNVTIYFDL